MRFWRKWHRTISILITLPFAITLVTGILLTTRGYFKWLDPDTSPTNGDITISFAQILESAKSAPEAKIQSWSDVSQIDIRPALGKIRVRSKKSNIELQIDPQTAQVLRAEPRRVGFITALHEGAYFGSIIRYGLFVPAAIGVLFLMISGWYLILKPKYDSRIRTRRKPTDQSPVLTKN